MITPLTRLGIAALLVAAAMAGAVALTHKAEAPKTDANAAAAPATSNIDPIPLDLPKPRFEGTGKNVLPGTHVKITEGPAKPRPPFLAPKGTRNVALKRPVTASDSEPVNGTLDRVTDGNKEAVEDAYVELGPGVQWVQIDLGASLPIYAIVLWHEHRQPVVYHDVIIQVSDDKDFIENVRTLFNNDHDNSAGMGIGEDWGYFETNEGLLAPAKGVQARYVRLYSNGNTADDLNRYTEVEVYALPAGQAAQQQKAAAAPAATPAAVPKPPAATQPAAAAPQDPNSDLVPLRIDLPKPPFISDTSRQTAYKRMDPNGTRPRKPFLAPKGCANVARRGKVTLSDKEPVIGEPGMLIDGDKEYRIESVVELGPGVQWAQIDLGSAVAIHAIVVWHEHRQPVVYHNVVVQVSDDKDFARGVRTLFNNDHDNSAGLGKGNDYEYFETNEGKLVDAGGVRARYVRLYSNGNYTDDLNRYTEVEVYGLPTKTGKSPKTR
jgi:hypothetical protein